MILLRFCLVITCLHFSNILSSQADNLYDVDSLFIRFSTLDVSQDKEDGFKFLNTINLLSEKLKLDFNEKRVEKSMKKIFSVVHKELFVKYVENPVLEDVFIKGEYNCVTASAVYSFLFEKMNIPYEIRELPTHVYVVVYPGTYNFIVESTLPSEGIIELHKKEMLRYREELLSNKMISEEELQDNQDLFNSMMSDSIITLKNLYGVQLYNSSFTLTENEEYKKAIDVLNKAKSFHDREYMDYFKGYNLGLMAESKELLTSNEKCFIITNFYDLIESEDDVNKIPATIELFYQIAGEIDSEMQTENIRNISHCINQSNISEELKKEITNATGISNAVYYYNALELKKAMNYLVKSFDSENKNSYRLIKEVFATYSNKIDDPYNGLDTLSKYENIFPFFKSDFEIQGSKVWYYMKIIHLKFELNEVDEGVKYLKEFESKFRPDDYVKFHPDLIGAGYGAASSYYVRENNEKKAKEILEFGLKYSKNSLELNRKLKLLNSDSW